MSKMKIMHLLKSDCFSGAENVVCQIIDLCESDKKYEFVYCSTCGPIQETLRERNIHFFGVDKFDYISVKRAIDIIDPDIIHAHDMGASVLAALCCGNRKLVITIHNNAPENSKLDMKTFLFNMSTQKASHIFWVSDSAYQSYYYRKNVEGISSVLYNIIDIDTLNNRVEEDSKTYDYDVLFLGRLSVPKNPLRLLKIFRHIADEMPEIKLAIAGRGELEKEVKEQAMKLNLKHNLEFLGYINNPYKLLKSSKVMIMTSIWEGTPMSSLEAMALGVPIVCTPAGGLKDVVIDGKTGFLSDDDEVLVEKCIELVNNVELRKQLSVNSVNRALKINDIEMFKDEIEKAYD